MRTMLFALALCGVAFADKGTDPIDAPEATVYSVYGGAVPPVLMYQATAHASKMFATIGVRIEWKTGTPHPEPGCRRVLVLTVADVSPENLRPGVRARTSLADGNITVFYDRIRPWIERWPHFAPTILAHMFAHEIAHALQGVSRHWIRES